MESTWPAMIAGPIAPGAGPSAYQPGPVVVDRRLERAGRPDAQPLERGGDAQARDPHRDRLADVGDGRRPGRILQTTRSERVRRGGRRRYGRSLRNRTIVRGPQCASRGQRAGEDRRRQGDQDPLARGHDESSSTRPLDDDRRDPGERVAYRGSSDSHHDSVHPADRGQKPLGAVPPPPVCTPPAGERPTSAESTIGRIVRPPSAVSRTNSVDTLPAATFDVRGGGHVAAGELERPRSRRNLGIVGHRSGSGIHRDRQAGRGLDIHRVGDRGCLEEPDAAGAGGRRGQVIVDRLHLEVGRGTVRDDRRRTRGGDLDVSRDHRQPWSPTNRPAPC